MSLNENISIAVVIFVHNGESDVDDCIESAKLLSKRIVVVDIESTDKTGELAKKTGAEVYVFPKTKYVEPAREFGIKKARADWVLLLDADERITPQLAIEIKSAIRNPQFSNYRIPRKNIFGRIRWLRYGGWWPDYQTRLISKKYFKSWPKEIHSTPAIAGISDNLQNPLVHYFHGDLENMVKKTIIFEEIESDLLFKADKSAGTPIFFRKYLGELYRRLLRNFGFLDGNIGIIESIYQAFSKTITYIYLYEKNQPDGRQGRTL